MPSRFQLKFEAPITPAADDNFYLNIATDKRGCPHNIFLINKNICCEALLMSMPASVAQLDAPSDETRRSRVQPPPRPATFFRGD